MTTVAALATWTAIGASMAESDPDGFVALVESAAERAGLRREARKGRPGRPDLRVIDGGVDSDPLP